jgi:3-deoxy-D-manno-octulosonate 8-phosphate phosphatase, YrbI family
MDVDGTMTDGTIYISSKEEVMKGFDVKDGYGIKNILPGLGIIPVIISARDSDIVRVRAKELNVSEVYLGVSDKLQIMEAIMEKHDLKYKNVAYIGDDLNDLPLIESVGISFAPFDSVEEVKKAANIVLKHCGGRGAIRECISHLTLVNNSEEESIDFRNSPGV